MNLRAAFLCMLLASGAGVTAIAAMRSAPAPDERREVAGWQVEDFIDRDREEPARLIRMTRRAGGETLVYEIVAGYGWPGHYQATSDGGNCSRNVDFRSDEVSTPALRGPAIRAALASVLPQFERLCGLQPGSSARLLDGFEPAFALLTSWYDRRRAECQVEALGNQLGNDCPLESSSNSTMMNGAAD